MVVIPRAINSGCLTSVWYLYKNKESFKLQILKPIASQSWMNFVEKIDICILEKYVEKSIVTSKALKRFPSLPYDQLESLSLSKGE